MSETETPGPGHNNPPHELILACERLYRDRNKLGELDGVVDRDTGEELIVLVKRANRIKTEADTERKSINKEHAVDALDETREVREAISRCELMLDDIRPALERFVFAKGENVKTLYGPTAYVRADEELVIAAPEEVPAEYRSPDPAKIKEALDKGIVVPGAHLKPVRKVVVS